jgi:hypothetical protein
MREYDTVTHGTAVTCTRHRCDMHSGIIDTAVEI